ncbi:MAG: pyrimidine/purine nucleoside phosphorylase [Cellulophaga sp.]|nr:pyrimidine/purine nucleoside phosphorylase [Cellulophaga sp.]
MFKTNTYFDNHVVSIAFNNKEGKATIGVMAPGDYTFGTNCVEIMTVISGEMLVRLKESEDFVHYVAFDSFEVPANSSFQVSVKEDTSYKCIYL